MPEPIMAPITTMVASKRFSPRTKPCSRVAVGEVRRLMAVCQPIVSEAGCKRDYNWSHARSEPAWFRRRPWLPPESPRPLRHSHRRGRSGRPRIVPPFQAPIEFTRQDVARQVRASP